MFPFYGVKTKEATKEIPLCKEIKWNIAENKPVFLKGVPIWVYGKEAIKTWCYKVLQIKRYKLEMYSWNYGVEFEKLIGTGYSKQYTKSECARYIEEALTINPYIRDISDIVVDFIESKLSISCTINTIYGDEVVSINV